MRTGGDGDFRRETKTLTAEGTEANGGLQKSDCRLQKWRQKPLASGPKFDEPLNLQGPVTMYFP